MSEKKCVWCDGTGEATKLEPANYVAAQIMRVATDLVPPEVFGDGKAGLRANRSDPFRDPPYTVTLEFQGKKVRIRLDHGEED